MIVAHTLSVLLGRTLAMNFAASLLTLTTCVLGLMGAHAGDGDTIANVPPATTAPPVTQNEIPRTVRLGKVPSINLGPQPPVTPQEAAKIKRLIASLASIDSPDFGLSSTMSGTAFAPIAGSEQMGAFVLTNHQIRPSETVCELVRLGPRALPFLLAALDDRTPTRLTVRHYGWSGGMGFNREIRGNPWNAAEQRALASVPQSSRSTTRSPGDLIQLPVKPNAPWDTPDMAYTVTVGDVCFVVIGQIVGRPYEAVRYQPTEIIVLNSPPHEPALAARVRAIWTSKDASQHLLAALEGAFGAVAKPLFIRYMQAASVQRCVTLCSVLRQSRQKWDLELLAPLLLDKRPLSWTHPVSPSQSEPSLPIRVCDEAAGAISENHPDLPFKMTGAYEDLNRQIAAMRERISKWPR